MEVLDQLSEEERRRFLATPIEPGGPTWGEATVDQLLALREKLQARSTGCAADNSLRGALDLGKVGQGRVRLAQARVR